MENYNCLVKKLSLFSIIFMMLTMIACEKEGLVNNETTPTNITEVSDRTSSKDAILDLCAKVFAQAQKEDEFRKIITQEIEESGSNSVFYVRIKNQRIGEITVSEFFYEIATSMEKNIGKDYFTTQMSDMMPNLSFSFYSGDTGTDLNELRYDEPVYILPSTSAFDNEEESTGTAYDLYLKEVNISNTNDPDVSVIVVEDNTDFVILKEDFTIEDIQNLLPMFRLGPCEAMWNEIENVVISLGGIHPSDPLYGQVLVNLNDLIELYMLLCDEHDPGNGGSDPDPTDPECSEIDCGRNNVNGRDNISKIRVEHAELKKFCKWWKKSCKIQVDATYATLPQNVPMLESYPTKFIIGKRKDMKKDKTFYTNLNLFEYDYCEGVHGDPYAITFIGKHHKAGLVKNMAFSLPDVSFSILGAAVNFSGPFSFSTQYTVQDNPLGGDLVYYCDDITGDGTEYTTGSMDFWVREVQ